MTLSSVGDSSLKGNSSLPPAPRTVSNLPLSQVQALEQWEDYKTSIDRHRLYQDWPALRQSYRDAINFLKFSRNQGYFSEEKIDKRLRNYLTAHSQFEREQGDIASAERLAQEIDWLAPSFNTNSSKKRDLERGNSSEFRNPKGGALNFLDRPQITAVNAEIDTLINGVNQISLQQHSRLFLRTSLPIHQFSWPTSPNEITETSHLVDCLREGYKHSMYSAQLLPYQALTEKILECFGKETYPSLSAIQEVVILVKATQNLTHYRRLIDQLQTTPQQILNMAALQGLAALMQHRSKPSTLPDIHFFNDCTKLLDYIHQLLIRTRRKDNTVQLGALLQTSSLLLDSLFDAVHILDETEFKGSLEESLAALTDVQDTKSHMDESLAYQAKYALQALKRLRQPKEWRGRVWDILRDFGGAAAYGAGAITSKDPDKFWEAIDKANSGFSKLKDEWQSYYKQREWYLALYRIDKAIETSYLNGLELFVQGWSRPKKRYLLQGLCFRLERIALSQMEDETKAWSLNLLKSLMAGDSVWGREKDLVGVKSCASATLQRISHFWNLPTTELMERVDYAPPAWHPFWMEQPQSTLLTRVQQKVKREEAIHARLTGLDLALTAGFAQTALQIEAGQSNMQMQGLFQSMIQHALALQASQQQVLHPKLEPLSILGHDIATFKAEYKEMLQETGEMDVLSMYVPLRGFEKGQKSGPTIDLESELEEFFNSQARVCLILGSAGTGKSTFNRYLALKMLDEYQGLSTTDQCRPLVFFVELRSIPDPNEKAIEQYFNRQGFAQEQINLLRNHPYQHCIFIFDGYDEIKERNRDFYGSNELWRWKQAKFVITSRPEYLDPNYALYFRQSNQPNSLHEYTIAPFSVEQRVHYIQNYVDKACPTWTVDDYKQAFSQLNTLESELARPIVLRLLLKTFPELNIADLSCLTLGMVYEHYFRQWWSNWQSRLGKIRLTQEENDAMRSMAEKGGFVSHGFNYIGCCALALTQSRLALAQDDDDFSQRYPEVHQTFFNPDAKTRLLRFNSPLQLDSQRQYRFPHKSMQEYLVARSICPPNFTNQTVQGMDAINQLSVVKESVILGFLVEQVQQQPIFKTYLENCIEASKTQVAPSPAAANAITVLVRAGVQFIGEDLTGIRIPGADVSYGVFDSVQLCNTDLCNVNFTGSWLRNADLTGSWMEGASFGELPSLEFEYDVNECSYSPDGRCLAVAMSSTIALYEVETSAHVYTFEGHTEDVCSVAFSGDSQMLASGSDDTTVRLWSVREKKALHMFEGHTGGVFSVAFSYDGQMVVSGSDDYTVRLWSVGEKKALHKFEGHTGGVFSVAFSYDGQMVVSGSDDYTVRLWSVGEKKALHKFEGHNGGVMSVAFSGDGQMVASGSWDRTVRLWSVRENEVLHKFEGHTGIVFSVAFSCDGQMLASGSMDSTVRLWSVREKKALNKFEGHTSEVNSVAFSGDGQILASGGSDRTVRLWSVEEKIALHKFEGYTGEVNSVAFSGDGKMLASGSRETTVRLWSVREKKALPKFEGHTSWVNSVAFSGDGKMLASGSRETTVRLWSVGDKKALNKFEGHTSEVISVAFSSDGQMVASGSYDTTVRLWSVGEKKALHKFEGHTGGVMSVAFSGDGQMVASGSWDRTVRLWSVGEKKALHKFEGHTRGVMSVAFSGDGQMVASGCFDRTVRLYSVISGECLTTIQGFNNGVNSVDWHTNVDGEWLATGGDDKIIRIWRVHRNGEAYCVTLLWSTAQTTLTVPGMSIQNVNGLSAKNTRLLKQRGAIVDSSLDSRMDI